MAVTASVELKPGKPHERVKVVGWLMHPKTLKPLAVIVPCNDEEHNMRLFVVSTDTLNHINA